MSRFPTAEEVTRFWGERCPDYEPECPCCQAWALFDGRAEAFEQAAQIADRYAVDAEKQAATAADGVAHDALLMASDFCELLAGELREQAIRKASGESA